MSEQPKSNGNALTYKWLVGILVVVLLGIASSWVASVQSAVAKVPVLESRMAGIDDSLQEIKGQLSAISGALRVPVK